jgi:hypothetical protein
MKITICPKNAGYEIVKEKFIRNFTIISSNKCRLFSTNRSMFVYFKVTTVVKIYYVIYQRMNTCTVREQILQKVAF